MKKICSLILFLILIGCNKNADKQTTISSSQNELINSYSSPFPENTQLSIAIISDNKANKLCMSSLSRLLFLKIP
jgi:ABC-type uncharacterized transport system auxiliary subunit